MRRIITFIVLIALAPLARGGDAPWPFFAFDNGVGRGKWTPEQQAQVLKDLGYAGIGYTGSKDVAARLKAFDAAGLKVFSIYVPAQVGPKGPSFDPALPEAIKQYKGRDVIIWLTVNGKAATQAEGDAQAVKVVREVADLAAESGLRVSLYHHTGFYVATAMDSLRIAKAAERKNVGATFNLCHFLKTDKAENLEKVVREMAPHLNLVSINGADLEGDWSALIKPLDQGKFDNARLLKLLKEVGYRGPIGLQCYQVPGDEKTNLGRSMAAWRKMVGR